MNINEIVAMTLGIGCIRPWSGGDLELCNIHRHLSQNTDQSKGFQVFFKHTINF